VVDHCRRHFLSYSNKECGFWGKAMKVEVYSEPTEPEQVLRLALEEREDGVWLVAVDKHGTPVYRGSILSVNNEGVISLCPNVNEDIGLELTEDKVPFLRYPQP